MKIFRLVLFAVFFAGLPLRVGAEDAQKSAAFGRLLNEQLTVLPLVWEFDNFRFKPHDKDVPDELRAEISGRQLRLWGAKKSDTKTIMGRLTGSFGKVAFFHVAPQSGRLLAKVQSIKGVNRYGIALDLTNGALKCEAMWLEPNTDYVWKSSVKDSQFVLELTAPGQREFSVAADVTSVRGFGFFATVRYPASKAEMLVTFDEPSTELANAPKPEPPKAEPPVPVPVPTAPAANSNSVERFFVGKTWMTPGGSGFIFLKDGAGFRTYKSDKTVLSWQLKDTGVVETTSEIPGVGKTQTLYFQFVSAVEAYFGSSTGAMKEKLAVKE